MLQSENQRQHAIVSTTEDSTSIAPILEGLEGGIKGRYGAAYAKEAAYFVNYAQGKAIDCPITNKECWQKS